MKKIPLWKLKRESQRLLKNVGMLPYQALEYYILTSYYDLKVSRLRRSHAGEVPLTNEAAIYLIYPSNGLLGSHLQMLRQLNMHDISPILVSNLPLSKQDMAALKPLCNRVIERPNVGYDFGGYRDGVLGISGLLHDLDRLYLLNDSCWMIDQNRSWFDEVREKNVDFCGASAHLGLSSREVRELIWSDEDVFPCFHYTAYALSIGSRILTDAGFLKFWRKFHLSNDKNATVRRGEIGLTQWVLRRKKFSHLATCPLTNLDKEISSLDDNELDALLRNLVLPSHPKLRKELSEILDRNTSSLNEVRHERIEFVLKAISSSGLSYALPYYTTHYRKFQFVKKSPLWLSRSGSDTTMLLLSKMTGPMGLQAAEEGKSIRPPDWPV
ncbi:rhamnan synthesis F family protein [Roseovarius sp. S1116L3]|uniref:rhamnan synthesis F family protein n=1 Tax=Roseovarius roseus TaxID=3342636 RepID=UPI00372622CD